METSLWKLSAGFGPSFLETGWLARQFPRYTLAVGNSALEDLTRVSWKPLTVLASSEGAVSNSLSLSPLLYRESTVQSWLLGIQQKIISSERSGSPHASRPPPRSQYTDDTCKRFQSHFKPSGVAKSRFSRLRHGHPQSISRTTRLPALIMHP